jgi:hypothetical protein
VRAFAEWLYQTTPSVAIHSTLWLIRLLQATRLLTAGVAVGSGVMTNDRDRHRADARRSGPRADGDFVQGQADPVARLRPRHAGGRQRGSALGAGGHAFFGAEAHRRRAASGLARVAAGALSLLLWAAVVLLGRWIGFTKGYDFTIPPGLELGFPAP